MLVLSFPCCTRSKQKEDPVQRRTAIANICDTSNDIVPFLGTGRRRRLFAELFPLESCYFAGGVTKVGFERPMLRGKQQNRLRSPGSVLYCTPPKGSPGDPRELGGIYIYIYIVLLVLFYILLLVFSIIYTHCIISPPWGFPGVP